MDTLPNSVKGLRLFAKDHSIKVPSAYRKDEIITLITSELKRRRDNGDVTTISTLTTPTRTRPFIFSKLTPVYIDTSIGWYDHLLKKGWTVIDIPGWLDTFVSDFFDFLEDCCDEFDRNDKSTWKAINMPISSRGIFKQYIGHSKFCWEIRKLCACIFANIFAVDEEDLLCSFDGGCFMAPHSTKLSIGPIHNDTPREMRDITCYQGVVNMVDNGPTDGGLVLLDNPKLDDIDDYYERNSGYGYSWEEIDMRDKMLHEGRRLVKVCAKPGQLILWDGRLFHANTQPTSDNYRMCTYVSMVPRSLATSSEIKRAVKMYEKGSMTGHWRVGPYFATNAAVRTWGKEVPKPKTEIRTEVDGICRKLVGY